MNAKKEVTDFLDYWKTKRDIKNINWYWNWKKSKAETGSGYYPNYDFFDWWRWHISKSGKVKIYTAAGTGVALLAESIKYLLDKSDLYKTTYNDLIDAGYSNGTFDNLMQISGAENRDQLEYFIDKTEQAMGGLAGGDSSVVDSAIWKAHYDYDQIMQGISAHAHEIVDASSALSDGAILGALATVAVGAGIIACLKCKDKISKNTVKNKGKYTRELVRNYYNRHRENTEKQQKRDEKLDELSRG